MLEISDLSVYAGKTNILQNISFTAQNKQLTGILAPNGTGKTQMLKLISGILPLKQGAVLVNGAIAAWDGKTISYLPQKIDSTQNCSCEDYVLLGRTPYISLFSSPNKADRKIAAQALEQAGVSHLSKRSFHTLSGGEQRRVSIAKLLAQDTGVMLLDEPCAYLDFKRQQRIMQLIQSIVRTQNKCAVLTLHDPSLALKYCDKIIFIDHGGILAQMKMKTASMQKINHYLKAIYGKEIQAVVVGQEHVVLWNGEQNEI